MGGPHSLTGRRGHYFSDPDHRTIDANGSNPLHHRGRVLPHGVGIPLFEHSYARYQFQDPRYYAYLPGVRSRLSLRADQLDCLFNLAARIEQRCDGAVYNVPQCLRLSWYLRRDRFGDQPDPNTPILFGAMGDTFPSAVQRIGRALSAE